MTQQGATWRITSLLSQRVNWRVPSSFKFATSTLGVALSNAASIAFSGTVFIAVCITLTLPCADTLGAQQLAPDPVAAHPTAPQPPVQQPAALPDAVPAPAPAPTLAPESDPTRALPPQKLIRGYPLIEVLEYADGQRETELLFSLWSWGRGPRMSFTYLTPFYFGRTERGESWSLTLPLYYTHSTPRSFELLSPFAVFRSGSESSLLPAANTHSATDSSPTAPLPATASGVLRKERRSIYLPGLLPLYRRSSENWTGGSSDSTAPVPPPSLNEALGIPYLFDLYGRAIGNRGFEARLLTLFPWGERGRSGLSVFQYAHRQHRTSPQGSSSPFEFGLFPIIYRSVDALRSRWIFWPLLLGSQRSTEQQRYIFAPLLATATQSLQSDDYSWSALVNLWSGGREGTATHGAGAELERRHWLKLVPLVEMQVSPQREQLNLLSLYRYHRDGERRLHALLKPVPDWPGWMEFEEKPGSFRRQHILPLYFSRRDLQQEEQSYWALFPFYGSAHDRNDHYRFVFPTFFQYQRRSPQGDSLSGLQLALPFYYHDWGPQHETTVVFPFHASHANREVSWNTQLAIRWERQEYRHGDLVGARTSWLARWIESSWSLNARQQVEHHFHALPFVWWTTSPQARMRLIAPFYLYTQTPTETQHWILPVYGKVEWQQQQLRERRDFYAGGILSRKQTFDGAEKLAQGWDLLGPLAGFSADKREEQRHSRWLPFWWSRSDRGGHRRWLFPFYYDDRTLDGGDNGQHPSPHTEAQSNPDSDPQMGASTTTPDRARETRLTAVLGNLWVRHIQGDERSWSVLWPFTRYATDPQGWQSSAFGVFERSSRKLSETQTRETLRMTPLFDSRPPETGLDLWRYFHFYSRRRGEFHQQSQWMPFIYSSRSFERGEFHSNSWYALAGLWGGSSRQKPLVEGADPPMDVPQELATSWNHEWHRRWLPFYYQQHKLRRYSGDPKRRDTEDELFLLPFYASSTKVTAQRIQSTRVWIPLLSWTLRDTETHSVDRWGLAGLARYHSDDRGSGGHLFPLASWYSTHDGVRRRSRGLFWHNSHSSADEWIDSAWSQDGYLDPSLVHWRTSASGHGFSINPFLFSHRQQSQPASQGVEGSSAAPHVDAIKEWDALLHILHYEETPGEYGFHAFPCVEVRVTEDSEWWRFTPFFSSYRQPGLQTRGPHLDQLFHLYTHRSNGEGSNWALLGAIASGESSPQGWDFRLFHRWLHFRDAGSYSERSIQPLFTWENDPNSGRHYFSLLKFLYTAECAGRGAPTRRRILFIPISSG